MHHSECPVRKFCLIFNIILKIILHTYGMTLNGDNNQGHHVSLAGKISRMCGFGMAADGVDMQNGLEALETPELSETEQVQYGARASDVVQPQHVQKASDLMAECNERIYVCNVHMQEAALNVGNQQLAMEIGARWEEFTTAYGGDIETTGDQGYVDMLKDAVSAYNDCVYDMAFLVNSDAQAALEMRLNPEATTALGRAKVCVHVHAEQELKGLANEMQAQLDMRNEPALGLSNVPQSAMQLGMLLLSLNLF